VEPSEPETTSTHLQLAAEDLEDAKALDAAIRRNGETPLIPWNQAKIDLGLV
jgi:hypothetical protein